MCTLPAHPSRAVHTAQRCCCPHALHSTTGHPAQRPSRPSHVLVHHTPRSAACACPPPALKITAAFSHMRLLIGVWTHSLALAAHTLHLADCPCALCSLSVSMACCTPLHRSGCPHDFLKACLSGVQRWTLPQTHKAATIEVSQDLDIAPCFDCTFSAPSPRRYIALDCLVTHPCKCGRSGIMLWTALLSRMMSPAPWCCGALVSSQGTPCGLESVEDLTSMYNAARRLLRTWRTCRA